MFGADVLLSIPTESVAVRAIVASLVALLLVRLALRLTVRQPRLRAAAVLVPTLSLIAVVGLSWGRIDLPSLMIASEAENALALPFGNDYLRFVPVTWPAAVGLWSAVATLGVTVRLLRVRRSRSHAQQLFTLRSAASGRLNAVVDAVAARLRVTAPPAAVGEDVVGGASVVGVRRPMLLVDRELLESLDDEELEGLVAHELAHVRRRDNLVALLVGVCRDLAFFVPGGRWVTRQLHNEREAAADALAVEVTGRPGALASGLLKALDVRQPELAGAASLSPGSTLESRVRRLCATEESPRRMRRVGEGLAILAALAGSVALAVAVPAWLAERGEEPIDGLAVLWSSRATEQPDPGPVELTAFSVYRDTGFETDAERPGRVSTVRADDGRELNPALLRVDPIDGRAPADRVDWTIERRPSLGLRPPPSVTIDAELLEDWRATSLLQVRPGLGVYLFSRGEQ